MDINEVWARLGNDEDAQETIMAAHHSGGRLSRSTAQELPCGDSAFLTLDEMGLVEPLRLDGSLNLNARGKKVAGELAEDLKEGGLRQRALERAVLKVARSLQPEERIRAADVVERMEPAKHGRAWNEAEVEKAVNGLQDEGLVDALSTWQTTFLAGITRRGRARLSPAGGSSQITSIFNDRSLTIGGDNLGNAATGDHVTQTSTVNSLASDALEFLLGHVDDLPEEVQKDVRDQVGAVHKELAQASPDRAKAVRWLQRTGETLDVVAGSPKVANFLAVLQLVAGVLLGG